MSAYKNVPNFALLWIHLAHRIAKHVPQSMICVTVLQLAINNCSCLQILLLLPKNTVCSSPVLQMFQMQ